MGVHLKIQFLMKEGDNEKSIYRGNYLKRVGGGLAQFVDLRGA